MNFTQPTGINFPLTVATTDITRIPTLVEKHKVLYTALGYSLDKFSIADTLYAFNMTTEQYEEEISVCDIVDED